MNRNVGISFFLTICFILQTKSQEAESAFSQTVNVPDSIFIIDKILVTGNSHTKDFVILREMSLQKGMRIVQRQIEYDKNRIYSLGLFNQVEIGVIPTVDSLATILVSVHERWYIFPYPIFGLKDRDWSKIFYGFGIAHTNFLGRNEKIFSSFIFGFDPSVKLSYRNPFLSIDGSNFLNVNFSYAVVRNRSLLAQAGTNNFDERHLSSTLTLGKRLGIEHNVWLSAGYEMVRISEYQPGRTISSTSVDHFPIVGIGYVFDTRDLMEYPSRGTFTRFAVTKFGIPGNELDIVRYALDLRQFYSISSHLVIQGRAFTDLVAAGTTPTYNRTFYGYGKRIRGHFDEVMEGEHIFGVSAELHHVLLTPRFFKVEMLPEEFSVWRFGVSAAVFADAGAVWFRGQPFAVNQFTKGYGAGLHFLLPYSAVVRIEYAWNEARRGEFIFDLGAAF